MDAGALLQRGELLLEQGRYADAERHIKDAIAAEPDNDYALALLGRCYLNNKKYDEGIRLVQQAISIDPENDFYFYLLGFGQYQKNENVAAAVSLRQAIALNPYLSEAFGLLAFCLLEQRQFEPALAEANQGLAVDPENLTCLNARATALNKLRRTDEAFATMDNALAQDPEDANTHATVGWNHLERGRNREAEKHFTEALRLKPDYPNAQAGLKQALKSRMSLYKWMLQYSFWVSNKGKKFATFMPIVLYILFRILIGLSGAQPATAPIALLLILVYLLYIVISWSIDALSNFVLLLHPVGKHAVSSTERWSAIATAVALICGLLLIVTEVLFKTDEPGIKQAALFLSGLICISLALPLGHIQFPISVKNRHLSELYSLGLIALAVLIFIFFAWAPGAAGLLLVVYAIAFIAYNWLGLGRQRSF